MALLTDRLQISAVTTNDFVHIVDVDDTSENPAGSSYKAEVSQVFDALTGYPLSQIITENVSSVSQVDINSNNSNDVTLVKGGGNLGIGVSPSYKFHLSGSTSLSQVYFNDISTSPSLIFNSNSTQLPFMGVNITPSNYGLTFGVRGLNETLYSGYGSTGDTFIYSSSVARGLNIINQPGISSPDYIRFYAGSNPSLSSSQIHIQGSGLTLGYVGINNEIPESLLDVSGFTGNSQFRLRTPYTPSGSGDTTGGEGEISWDNDGLYVKTSLGWGQSSLDYSFGSPTSQLYNLTITIPSADVLQLFTTPYTLVPAVVGKIIVPIVVVGTLSYNTTQYATNGNLYTAFPSSTRGLNYVTGSDFLFSSVLTNGSFLPQGPNTGLIQYIPSEPLTISCENGNPTAGDSDIVIGVLYTLI